MSEGYEYTILQKQNLILYQIPPLASAKGHYLDTWKDMIWNGNLKVVSKSNCLTIKFFNLDGSLFAQSPVPRRFEEAVQKCVDSSRGFAIRLQNSNGKYAWVGLAFRDRNDAFDFNVCFKDFEEKVEAEKNPDKYKNEFNDSKDWSIKQGEKIKISFGGGVAEGKKKEEEGADFSNFNIDLNSNPYSKPQEKPQSKPQVTNSNSNFDNWSSFSQIQPSSSQSQPKNNDFGFGNFMNFNDFGNFGGNNNPKVSSNPPAVNNQSVQLKKVDSKSPGIKNDNLLDLL